MTRLINALAKLRVPTPVAAYGFAMSFAAALWGTYLLGIRQFDAIAAVMLAVAIAHPVFWVLVLVANFKHGSDDQ